MGIYDFLEERFPNWIKKARKVGGTYTITLDIPAELALKELAIYTGVSLIANAISGCIFETYENFKKVKNLDWYILNIAPNKNDNASIFWNKVVNRMIRSPSGALVVEIGGELHVASDFVVTPYPVLGNIYSNIVLDHVFNMNRSFKAHEVYHFKLEDEELISLFTGLQNDYDKLLTPAIRAFKESNATKYKLKISSLPYDSKDTEEKYEELLKEQVAKYLQEPWAAFVQYDGFELEREDIKNQKSFDDIHKIKKDIFQTVAQALKIPVTLMDGNLTSMKDIVSIFLTFGIDPKTVMMEQVLNKRATYLEVSKGNFYRVNTSGIIHRDFIQDAPNIDKLIGSGFRNIDEIKEEFGEEPFNETWSRQHWMTKNYGRIEDVATGVNEGGDTNANTN